MNRAFLVSLVILAAGTARSQAYHGPTIKRNAERDRRSAHYNALRREAQAAETTGDYAAAESFYKEAEALYPNNPFERIDLARLYDKGGRDRDAFIEYRAVLVGAPGGQSSLQREPAVLARYGDLCLRFSTLEEAARAFHLAVVNSDRDDIWEPRPVPRNDSFASLRAAAHAAAAATILSGSLHQTEASHELDLAIAADPGYWAPYFYRAYIGPQDGRSWEDQIRDAATAERLAPPKGRRQVRWMRMGRGIPDVAGRRLVFPARRDGLSWQSPPDLPDPAGAGPTVVHAGKGWVNGSAQEKTRSPL